MIPPRSILAATDFSEASRVAVTLAACLARHCHASLHLVHAEDPLLGAAARRAGIDLGADTRAALQSFMASIHPASDYAPMHHVVTGPAAESIVDVAAAEQVDLIVIGSRGMSGASRLLFGSTAERVIRHAGVSVLTVPPEWRPLHPDSPDLAGTGPIVVGMDFSESSVEAARAACGLAESLGTCAEVVHVVPELHVLARWRAHADQAVSESIDAARRRLDAIAPRLPSIGCLRTHVEVGGIAERLAAIAAREGSRSPILILGRQPGRRGSPPGALAYQLMSLCAVPILTYVLPEVSDAQR
jgi:nucleotide-binding universal stress UspA family protein